MLFLSSWFSSFVDASQLKNITYAKCSEKITFLKYVCVSGAKWMTPNFSFVLPVEPFWQLNLGASDKPFQPIVLFWLDDTLYRSTAQKMNFFIKDFFSNCDQIRRKLEISLFEIISCLYSLLANTCSKWFCVDTIKTEKEKENTFK